LGQKSGVFSGFDNNQAVFLIVDFDIRLHLNDFVILAPVDRPEVALAD